jgi:uncharacterized protein YbjT (DUF2867 family)
MTAVIMIGGSGLVGKKAAARLATAEHLDFTSFVRRPPHASYERQLSFEGLLRHGREALGIDRADIAISCLGTTLRQAGSKGAFRRVDFDYVHAFARAAQRLGARQFILVSSVGATRRTSNFYLSVKGEIEAAVARLEFERVDVIRPGLLLGTRREMRPAERLAARVMPLVHPLLRGDNARYRATPSDRVARAIVDLVHAGAAGRYLYENPQLDVLA